MAIKITQNGIDTIQDNIINSDKIQDNSISPDDLPSGSVVGAFKQTDSSSRSYGTGWAIGMTWDNFIKPAGTNIHFSSSIPVRNDSTSWGGAYVRLEYSIDNGGSWASLGDTGYDAVMEYGQSIGQWHMSQIIDKQDIRDSYQVRFRFYHRSYDGTMTIKGSNGITDGNGYAFGHTQISLLAIKV